MKEESSEEDIQSILTRGSGEQSSILVYINQVNISTQRLTVKESEASEIIVIPCLRMLDQEPNRE